MPVASTSSAVGPAGLGPIDGLVIVGYLALLAVVAWRTRPRLATTEDYFLGGRSLPSWAVAISFMATAMSAASIVGLPQKGYGSGFNFLATSLGGAVAIAVVAFLFIPAFYRASVTTVYGLLEHRIGPRARIAAGVTFIIGRILASGARLYIAGTAVAYLLCPPEWRWLGELLVIGSLALVAIGFVWVGGIRSVVWTDVCQAAVFLCSALAAIAVLVWRIPVPFDELVGYLSGATIGDDGPSRLSPVHAGITTFSWTETFSLPAILIGFSLLNLGAYGTDQDLAQRLLTCKDRRAGMRSAWLTIAFSVPMTLVFLTVGQLLWIYYSQSAVMGDQLPVGPSESKDLFLHFIVQGLPAGVAGLISAGILAAAVSSLTSELNALASSAVNDVWKPLSGQHDDAQALRLGRRLVPWAAFLLAATAVLCISWHASGGGDLIDFALMVMLFAYGGLVGVFLCVLVLRRGSEATAMAAMLVGFVATLYMEFGWVADHFALTWRMVWATVLAFGVCAIGRSTPPPLPAAANAVEPDPDPATVATAEAAEAETSPP